MIAEPGPVLSNARISEAGVRVVDHSGLVAGFVLSGDGWGCSYGWGVVQRSALDLFMTGVMECVGVDEWSRLNGHYVRVVRPSPSSIIRRIIHIVDASKEFDITTWAQAATERETMLSVAAKRPLSLTGQGSAEAFRAYVFALQDGEEFGPEEQQLIDMRLDPGDKERAERWLSIERVRTE